MDVIAVGEKEVIIVQVKSIANKKESLKKSSLSLLMPLNS